MSAPLLLADNLGSVTEYPKVVLTDQSGTIGPAGFEAWRPFSSRRSSLNYWQPGTTNIEAWIQLDCHLDQVRGANCFALDRGHNLQTFPIKLQGSMDGATFVPVVTPTVPSTGGQLAGANGVTTEEGAFLITFPSVGYTYWRIDVPALGVGLQPTIPGAYLGMSYVPTALYRPFGRHPTELRAAEIVSPLGWRGRGPRAFNRAATFNLRMDTQFEYVQARFTLEELYGAGRPMWVVEDQSRPTEAWLALRPLGAQGFAEPPNWSNPVGTFAAIEHEPNPVS